MDTLRNLWKTTPFRIAIVLLALLAIGVGYYFASVPVKVGTKVVCRYGHVISDDTYTLRVPKFLADRFKVTEKKSVCAKHERAERLYARAQGKIANKDYTEAKKSLNEVKKIDPNFKRTTSQLSALNQAASGASTSGKSSSSGTSGGTSIGASPGGGAEEGEKPSSTSDASSGASTDGKSSGGSTGGEEEDKNLAPDLVSLLPQGEIPGYSRGALLTNGSAVLDYLPDATTRDKIGSLLITVHKYDSTDGPKNFIKNTSKVAYPNNQKSPSIKGREAYFGTSESGLATLTWPDGVLIYEILMRSATFEPVELYDDIKEIVKYFP